MSLLNSLRRVFGLQTQGSVAPVAANTATAPLEEQLSHQLVHQLRADFPALQIEWRDKQISLSAYHLVLETQILQRTQHPQAVVLGVGFRLYHEAFFPAGMMECLAGIGANDSDAIQRGVQNYLDSVLRVVLDGLESYHTPELDIKDATGQTHWHPILGNLQVQGTWVQRQELLEEPHYLALLQPRFQPKLTAQPFHWLKIYASRLPDGEFVGECQWDNEAWEEGLRLVEQDSAQWPRTEAFAGLKQFILFRRCGGGCQSAEFSI